MKNIKKTIILFLTLSFIAIACNDAERKVEVVENINRIDSLKLKDSLYQVKMLAECDTFPIIRYQKIVIKNRKELYQIRANYNETEEQPELNRVFCLLNRKARHYIRVGDTVTVPDKFYKKLIAYSLFPQYYHAARDIKKLLLVSNKYLCYAAYENGKQVWFAACNTGKEKTPTYPGRYSLVWKEKEHRSSLDSNWVMPYNWNFHQYAGCAFHQFTMPGYAASHSCVRQFREDARWLYYWGERAKVEKRHYVHLSGTPVIVIDGFDYRRKKTGPWVALKSNKELILDVPKKPMEVEDALIPICQIPIGSRSRLPHKKTFYEAEKILRQTGVIREGVVLTQTRNWNNERRKEEKRKKKEDEKLKLQLEEENLKTLDEESIIDETYTTDSTLVK